MQWDPYASTQWDSYASTIMSEIQEVEWIARSSKFQPYSEIDPILYFAIATGC